MTDNLTLNEILVDKKVTYHLEVDGQLFLIENVPARVNVETSEKLFSRETVEWLQQLIRQKYSPVRTIKTPVYELV